jgi:hypothetical protein
LLEVQQANFSLIEDPRIVVGRVLRQDLNVSIPETTNAEFIEVIVPPVECGLNSEMQMLQVPMNWRNQTAPDARLGFVDRNSDLYSVAALNIGRVNKVGEGSSRRALARHARIFRGRRVVGFIKRKAVDQA